MPHFSLIFIMLAMPLLGALFLLFIRGDEQRTAGNAYAVSMLISGCVFLTALIAWAFFGAHKTDVFSAVFVDMPAFKVSMRVGMDALTLFFVVLISFLTLLSVFISRKNVKTMVREYMFLTLIAESFLLAAVCARDLFLFYAAFEAAVIPLFLLIALWGVERRAVTPYRFGLFAIIGSVFLLSGVFVLYHQAGSSDFGVVESTAFTPFYRKLVFGLFVGAMAFKAPLFPFHFWLTDSLSEAPAAAGVLISGVYSKLIFYAFVRFVIPISGAEIEPALPYLCCWALATALYGALVADVQEDIRSIAGFAHLTQTGLLALGLFCLTPESVRGMLFLSAAQAVSMAAFLLACGALYQRVGYAKNIVGVLSVFPYLGAVFFLSSLALLAFPPMPAFTGQFLIFQAAFAQNKAFAALGLTAVMLLYVAFFKHFSRFLFGGAGESVVSGNDLGKRERTAAALLGAVFLYLALTPSQVFRLIAAAVDPLFEQG